MRYFLFALALFVTFAPHTAEAAFGFTQIVPPECKCDSVPIEGAPAGTAPVVSAPAWGCVLQTIQNVIRVGVALSFAFATLALMYAGFVWMTSGGSAERRNQGSHLLINVFIGIAVVLGSWLVVDFIMKELYSDEASGFGPWNNILAGYGESGAYCLAVRQPSPIATGTVDILTGSSGGAGGSSTGVTSPGAMSDEQARNTLRAGGVRIHNWNATKTLAGTRNDTINQTVQIKSACNCDVLVTATTGGSHQSGTYSHSNGYKVDLEDTPDLNAYLTSVLTRRGARSGDPLYYDSCGNEYARESTHWDITVNKGVCQLPAK